MTSLFTTITQEEPQWESEQEQLKNPAINKDIWELKFCKGVIGDMETWRTKAKSLMATEQSQEAEEKQICKQVTEELIITLKLTSRKQIYCK